MLLRSSPERQEAELRYVRDMNLNAMRFEGKMEDEHFLELCDRYGILVMAGWCCCDHWEKWGAGTMRTSVSPPNRCATSCAGWSGIPRCSTGCMAATIRRRRRSRRCTCDIIKECEWPNPYHSSATAQEDRVTGRDRRQDDRAVRVRRAILLAVGHEEWRRVRLQYRDQPGTRAAADREPAPDAARGASLAHRSWWDYHAGGGAVQGYKRVHRGAQRALRHADTVEDYARKAQMMAYEGQRAMFEAFGRNKYTSTGVIQWMLNNAWPGLIWHLYDWYLRPGGSLLRRQEGLRAAARAVLVRRPLGRGGELVLPGVSEAEDRGKGVRTWMGRRSSRGRRQWMRLPTAARARLPCPRSRV